MSYKDPEIDRIKDTALQLTYAYTDAHGEFAPGMYFGHLSMTQGNLELTIKDTITKAPWRRRKSNVQPVHVFATLVYEFHYICNHLYDLLQKDINNQLTPINGEGAASKSIAKIIKQSRAHLVAVKYIPVIDEWEDELDDDIEIFWMSYYNWQKQLMAAHQSFANTFDGDSLYPHVAGITQAYTKRLQKRLNALGVSKKEMRQVLR